MAGTSQRQMLPARREAHLQQRARGQQLQVHAPPKVHQLQAQPGARVLVACQVGGRGRGFRGEGRRLEEGRGALQAHLNLGISAASPAPPSTACKARRSQPPSQLCRPPAGPPAAAPASSSVTSRLSGLMSVCRMRAARREGWGRESRGSDHFRSVPKGKKVGGARIVPAHTACPPTSAPACSCCMMRSRRAARCMATSSGGVCGGVEVRAVGEGSGREAQGGHGSRHPEDRSTASLCSSRCPARPSFPPSLSLSKHQPQPRTCCRDR